ncbi:MAG: DUF4212 domain-containing protein [Natronomonas sp.]
MTENDTHTNDSAVETDGGTVTHAQKHRETDYLDEEVNLLKPSTPYMRDHLKLVWGTFIAWTLIVWGPVTATRLAPETMTSLTVLGFPLHYFLVALGGPTGALVLAAVYARSRDQLDDKYGIEHGTAETESSGEATAADGGVEE